MSLPRLRRADSPIIGADGPDAPRSWRVARAYRSMQPGDRYQTASFNSFEARNAIFLLALILIASPVAGLRPIRAARLRT